MSSKSLKRSLSLPMITFFGLGNILGAGIYVLVGKVAGEAGYYAPLAFLVASIIAVFSACTYAEMSARYPVSAGEAIFVDEGLNIRWLAIMVGLLITPGGYGIHCGVSTWLCRLCFCVFRYAANVNGNAGDFDAGWIGNMGYK